MAFAVPEKLEKFRVKSGPMASDSSMGPNGVFRIKTAKLKREFTVIVSDGGGWNHVSVSLPNRTPTWEEMCIIKDYFWSDEDTVVQYHPPKSDYINNHPYCLHLWQPNEVDLPRPPKILVGV